MLITYVSNLICRIKVSLWLAAKLTELGERAAEKTVVATRKAQITCRIVGIHITPAHSCFNLLLQRTTYKKHPLITCAVAMREVPKTAHAVSLRSRKNSALMLSMTSTSALAGKRKKGKVWVYVE